MGIPTGSYQGIITSWAGTSNAAILTAVGEHTANLRVEAGVAARTEYASGLTNEAYGPGLSTWEVTITSRLKTAGTVVVGYAGNLAIAGSDVYTSHMNAWSLTISAIAERMDEYQSTAVLAGWGQFIRGMMRASGTYSILPDATTALKMPFAPTTSLPTATFTLTGTANDTLAMSVIPTSLNVDIPIPNLSTGQYAFNASGPITVGAGSVLFSVYAGTSLGLFDFDYATPTNNNLVFQVASSRTLTGPAFVRDITINHAPAQYPEVVITAQGYGALTPA